MRNARRALAVVLLGAAMLVAEEKKEPSFAGNWAGSLDVAGASLPLVVKVQAGATPGALVATFDSPRQGARDIPLSEVTFADGKAAFKMPMAGGAFVGKMSADGAQIEGAWTQAGRVLPLTLKRVDAVPDNRRPQEPRPPYPYDEEEVTYANEEAGVTLAGTFTRPKEGAAFAAVLLISGSGPQDRDARVLGQPLYLVLADELTRAGLAVLRVDDRGVGRSTGTFSTATTEDFASDVRAGLRYLKSRKDVDPKRIGLYGHSEGGVVGPMVASEGTDVAFLVLAAAPGMPLEKVLPRQAELIERAQGIDEATIARHLALQKSSFAIVKEEKEPAKIEERLRALLADEMKAAGAAAPNAAAIDGQVRMLTSPWFRTVLTLDPRPFLMKVRCPVLAVNGEKDLQIPPENLDAVRAALEDGGNKDVSAVTLAGLNHLLQTCRTCAPSEYALLDETLAPLASKTIVDWVVARTKRDGRPAVPRPKP